MKKLVLILCLLATISFAIAQTTVISDVSHSGDASAVLDVYSTTKGLLFPRIALTNTSSASPVSSPATSLIVYNTASTGDVTPGYYYWNSAAWVRISAAGANSDITSLTGLTTPLTVAQGGTGAATLTGLLLGNGTSSMTATTSSSGISGVISDETGSGVLVFGTSPTFTTSITSPLIIGGSGTTSDLYLKTTSATGTSGADMHFLVGDNGGTEAMTILNSGNVGIGTNNPNTNQALHINHTTARSNQQALYSYATSGTSENRAIWGKVQSEANSANNYGVFGEVVKPSSGTGNNWNTGVLGLSAGSTERNYGVNGICQSSASGSSKYNIGVSGMAGYLWPSWVQISSDNTNFYGLYGGAYGTGTTGSVNYAVYGNASGAQTNYSFYGEAGAFHNVGIGSFGGTLTVPSLNTGNGDYELYAMDQDVQTSDAVSFTGITSTGSMVLPLTSKTSTYTVGSSDYTVICDASTGAFSVTLPASSGISGRIYIIKNVGSGGTVTVDGNGGETIDGATTYALTAQWSSIMIQSDNTNWVILSKN